MRLTNDHTIFCEMVGIEYSVDYVMAHARETALHNFIAWHEFYDTRGAA
jgi:hypothetical protein